jgi:peptidylprolyl isomerase
LIGGFEKTVIGMTVGESRTVNVPAEEAYGPYRDEMVLAVPRSQFPPDMSPEPGMQLQVGQGEGQDEGQEEGQGMMVTITKITDDEVTLDANHPLAGKALIFAIQLQ